VCESLAIHAALREKRADDGREYGDDKLNDSLPGLEILYHGIEVLSDSCFGKKFREIIQIIPPQKNSS